MAGGGRWGGGGADDGPGGRSRGVWGRHLHRVAGARSMVLGAAGARPLTLSRAAEGPVHVRRGHAPRRRGHRRSGTQRGARDSPRCSPEDGILGRVAEPAGVLRAFTNIRGAFQAKSRSQPISRVLLRGAAHRLPYDRHSSRRRVTATLKPPTRGLGEQPWVHLFVRLLGVAPDGGCRVSPAPEWREPNRGDSSLWPCSSPSSAARAIDLLRLGVTQHPALRSPDFPLHA